MIVFLSYVLSPHAIFDSSPDVPQSFKQSLYHRHIFIGSTVAHDLVAQHPVLQDLADNF